MKLSKGRELVPIKIVIYGSEGIGKTTLASQFPKPLFLDIENGSKQLDVIRVDQNFKEWNQVEQTLNELDQALTKDKNFCKTLVIDTIDVAEILLSEQIIKDTNNKRITSMSDFPWGGGQIKLREKMNEFLKKLDNIKEKHNIHIALLAHSHIKKFEKPDETGSFDRYELKLSTKVAERIKEWCDVLLFINYKTQIISSQNKMEKNKLIGGERVIYTTHHNAWDAKNRFSLPEELPLKYESIEEIFKLSDDSIHVVDEKDPVFDEPSITSKTDGTVETNGDLNDLDFTEIEFSVTDHLYELMQQDNVTEDQIIDALIQINKIPNEKDGRRPRISDLNDEFIQKNLIDTWDGFISFLHSNVA